MPANSPFRRAVKKLLWPLLHESVYAAIQAPIMALDIRRGTWNEPETELARLALQPGETALDIGANSGMFTWHLSRAAGPQGKVYAFEPVPLTARIFRGVAFWLGFRNVQFFEAGCSDAPGMIKFTVPLQASGGMSTGQAYISGRNDEHPGKEKQVRWQATRDVEAKVVKLDDTLPALPQLTLIKCDIEGAELLAFRGAIKLISATLPSVICEINPWYLEGFDFTIGDLASPFLSLGYAIYRLTGDPGSRRLSQVKPQEIEEDNYIFIHPSRLGRFQSVLQ